MPLSSRYQRILAQPVSSLQALRRRFLPSPRVVKSHEVYVALGSWSFGAAPRRPITEIFPGIEGVSIELRNLFERTPGTSVEPSELASICAIARLVEARNVVEIGTYDGNTTLNLAANTPDDSTIRTVDLPLDSAPQLAIRVSRGMCNTTTDSRPPLQYEATPLAAKIRQTWADSATIDWADFEPPVDLVFIDGCHHHDYVRHDTERALESLGPMGTILWHDYGISADVSRAVDGFADRLLIEAIRGQRLAVGRRRSPASS